MTATSSRLHRVALIGTNGLLLCAAVTAVKTLSQPLQDMPVAAILALVGAIAWTWLISGLWWALAAALLAELPTRGLAALVAPLALAITLVHLGTWQAGLTFSLDGGSTDLMGRARQPVALFLHVLWANLFFGGLYLLAFAGYRRAWRSRRLLAELVSSRAEIAAGQQEARLKVLRGQLQPGILVKALEALETSYASAPVQADALFDALVRFLRAAMPSVRKHGATLGSELALVRHYAELRQQMGSGRGAVIQSLAAAAPEVEFPALCLLPLIEALACEVPPDAPLRMHQTGGFGWTGAELYEPCGRQPLALDVGAEPERRLRLELTALHGAAADLMLARRAGETSVMLRLPVPLAVSATHPLPIKETVR